MAPFFNWLGVALLLPFPTTAFLPPIELANHVAVLRNHLLHKMVPTEAQVQTRGALTIIVQATQHTNQVMVKKYSTAV